MIPKSTVHGLMVTQERYFEYRFSLKVKAKQLNKTLYQVKTDLLRDYLRADLPSPRTPAFRPA